MREVTEPQFFEEIKRLGKAGRDPMPGRGQNALESIWKDQRYAGTSVVGKTTSDGAGESRFYLA